jgi:hypothetical protein
MARCGQTEDDRQSWHGDHKYTSSFNWAEQNYAAICCGPSGLVSNSFVTDVVNPGCRSSPRRLVESDAPYGHWALAYRTVFIGETQDPAPATPPRHVQREPSTRKGAARHGRRDDSIACRSSAPPRRAASR